MDIRGECLMTFDDKRFGLYFRQSKTVKTGKEKAKTDVMIHSPDTFIRFSTLSPCSRLIVSLMQLVFLPIPTKQKQRIAS